MQSSNLNKNDTSGESNNNTTQQTQNNSNDKKNSHDILAKIFIGNIPRSATDEHISEYFSEKGIHFKEMAIMKDPMNGSFNRGFGFFTLNSEEETDRLLFLDLEPFQGKNLDIKRAAPKDCDDPLIQTKTERIFVGGLPQSFTVEEITELFNNKYSNVGKVVEVIPKKDKMTGKSRGFCFIVFENYHVVDKIMIDNRFPYMHNKRLEVRKASSDFPTQGGPPNDPHATRRATPGGKVNRNFDRPQRANPHPYRNGSNNNANMRQPPRRNPHFVNNHHIHTTQYPKQTYGFTNRPPPSAYAEGIPNMVNTNNQIPHSSYGSHQNDIQPYGSATAVPYVSYGTGTSQIPTAYPAGANQYAPNPYATMNYPVAQSGYQTSSVNPYGGASTTSVQSSNSSIPNPNQNHPTY